MAARAFIILRLSIEVSAIGGRRKPGVPAKRGRECAGFAEPELLADLGDGQFGVGKQILGSLHSLGHEIAVGRRAYGFLECARKMKRAQVRDFRQCGHRNVFCEMFLDVLRYSLLLPCGETASGILRRRSSAVVQTHEFVGQYDAQSLGRYEACSPASTILPSIWHRSL